MLAPLTRAGARREFLPHQPRDLCLLDLVEVRAGRVLFLQSNALPLWESPFPVLHLDYQEKILVCISPLSIVTLVKICYVYSCFLLIPFLLKGHSFSLGLHFAMCLELGFVTSENVVSVSASQKMHISGHLVAS